MVHDIDHKPARHRAHECSDHACMNSTARRPWPRCWFVLEPTLSLSAVIQLRFKMALSENVTKTAGELYFIWNFSKYEAPNLKMYRPICVPSYFIMFMLVWRAVTTESKRSIERILRYTVFTTCLNPEKAWFALNTNLCCTKPSTFCSSAKLFDEEYALV